MAVFFASPNPELFVLDAAPQKHLFDVFQRHRFRLMQQKRNFDSAIDDVIRQAHNDVASSPSQPAPKELLPIKLEFPAHNKEMATDQSPVIDLTQTEDETNDLTEEGDPLVTNVINPITGEIDYFVICIQSLLQLICIQSRLRSVILLSQRLTLHMHLSHHPPKNSLRIIHD